MNTQDWCLWPFTGIFTWWSNCQCCHPFSCLYVSSVCVLCFPASLVPHLNSEILEKTVKAPGFLHTAVLCYSSLIKLFMDGQTPCPVTEHLTDQVSLFWNAEKAKIIMFIHQTRSLWLTGMWSPNYWQWRFSESGFWSRRWTPQIFWLGPSRCFWRLYLWHPQPHCLNISWTR